MTGTHGERRPEFAFALTLANTRTLIGLAGLLAPGPAARALLGASTPGTRALVRMVAGRDLVLGLGTATTLREAPTTGPGAAAGPGWMSWTAVADAVDAAALLFTSGLPRRARVSGLAAGVAAAVGWGVARRLAAAPGPRA